MFTQIRNGVPLALTCPISHKIMRKPVFHFETQMTYDEESLKAWLIAQGKPVENQFVTHWFLKNRLDDFLEKNADIFAKKPGLIDNPAETMATIPFTIRSSSFIEEDDRDFRCPISLEDFSEPVMAVDGHTYEKKYITAAWKKRPTISPLENRPLSSMQLFENHLDTFYREEASHQLFRAKVESAIESKNADNVIDLLRDPEIDRSWFFNSLVDKTYPLHYACQHGNQAVVIAVLDILYPHSPDQLNAPDNNGDTPLHHACRAGDRAMIETLILCGADESLTAKNAAHFTPLELLPRDIYTEATVSFLTNLSYRHLDALKNSSDHQLKQLSQQTINHIEQIRNEPNARKKLHLAEKARHEFRSKKNVLHSRRTRYHSMHYQPTPAPSVDFLISTASVLALLDHLINTIRNFLLAPSQALQQQVQAPVVQQPPMPKPSAPPAPEIYSQYTAKSLRFFAPLPQAPVPRWPLMQQQPTNPLASKLPSNLAPRRP